MTNHEGKPILSDDEIRAEFAALFPNGWAGPDVFAELAPDGWAKSPLAAVCHPTVEQVYEERVRMHRHLQSLPGKLGRPAPEPTPDPTFDEVKADFQETPVEAERECQELVGLCLWDVFSDNHEVFADDGRLVDLGSMRSSGAWLAEILNAQGGPPPAPRPEMPPELMKGMFPDTAGMDPQTAAFVEQMKKEMLGDGGYTYLDFYMGTGSISHRADLSPVYRMIFRRLFARGMDWEYHFPRLSLIDMRPLKKQLDAQKRAEEGEPEFAGYDPSAALAEEAEEQEHNEETAKFREQLDEGHREAVAAAREGEPPTVVKAYQAVYGDLPKGWPPEAEA